MNSMKKQMDLFNNEPDEMDAIINSFIDKKEKENKKSYAEGGMEDGGLKDEGGEVDPVSGNDVPPGSTKEEVRDDIPAQLSEGEFVFPADVVRYIGLENLMRMRQQAKQGLKMMEAMGQMGNSEDATIPDDLPFAVTDLIIVDTDDNEEYNKDKQEFNIGGMPTGTTTTSATGTYQTPSIYQPPQQQPIVAGSSQFQTPSTYQAPTQQFVPTVGNQQTADFGEYLKTTQDVAAARLVTIINPQTGEERQINYIPGVTTLPEGFVLKSDYKPEEQTKVATATTESTAGTGVVQQDDEGGGIDPADKALMESRIDAAKRYGIDTAINPFSIQAITGKFGPEDVGKFTNTGYIIGKGGVLLDPLTGLTKNQNTGSIITDVIRAIAGGEKPEPAKGFSQEFFDAMPDNAKDVLGRGLGKEARDERITEARELQKAAEERIEKARQEAEAKRISEAAAVRAEQRQMREEKAAEIAKEKARIAEVQRRAREQMGQIYESSDDSGGYQGSVQQQADDYTAQAVAEAVATGDYSRGFAEGGLAKQMKQSGLASKK